MSAHHPIFARFESVSSTGSGRHVFDFIGTATDVRYRRGWAEHAVAEGRNVTPPQPPANEHYFDWVATLQAVDRAGDVFRMAELGAGWAPWTARAALACRQRPAIRRLELIAVEADEHHHAWAVEHLRHNGVEGDGVAVLRGAIAAERGTIRFPRIANPDENYGASTRAATARGADVVEVPALTLADVLARFTGPLDFMHVDIQGAEYDALPPAMPLLQASVRTIMIGTHLSDELHKSMSRRFIDAGWVELMYFGRNETSTTEYGPIQFGDGFLLYRNPSL